MANFKLPIEYLDKKEKLSEEIKTDLELLNSLDDQSCLYEHVFKSESEFGKKTMKQWGKYYTSDLQFLKESQQLYEEYEVMNFESENEKGVSETMEKIKRMENFEDSYLYLQDVYCSNQLNNNETFALVYSIFLILSPVMTLCMPLMILVLPFIILRFQKVDITIRSYVNLMTIFLMAIS